MARPAATPMTTDDARAAAFDAFLSQQSKDRPGELHTLDDTSVMNVDVIPTGAISLDVALGVGGIPRGKIIELYGPEGGGKTSLALEIAAQGQEMGLAVGFVDAEHALNKELALSIGVDPARFVVFQPDSGEQGIEMVDSMVRSGAFGVVIVDSVAALVPTAELEADVEQQGMGQHARLMSKFMRRIMAPCSETNTALILINQIRADLGAYGTPEKSTGGRAIKFAASVRIEVRSSASKRITRDGVVVGQTCVVKIPKNRVAPPYTTCEYDLIFGKGIEAGGALLEVCEKLGLVTRAGSSYTDVTTGERLGIGKENVKSTLEADPELAERLVRSVYDVLEGRPALAPVADTSPEDDTSAEDGTSAEVAASGAASA